MSTVLQYSYPLHSSAVACMVNVDPVMNRWKQCDDVPGYANTSPMDNTDRMSQSAAPLWPIGLHPSVPWNQSCLGVSRVLTTTGSGAVSKLQNRLKK